MKITVIGGAGVRAPLLIGSLAKRAKMLDIDEVAIYDIDPRKVGLIVPLAKSVLEKAGNPYKLTVAETPEEAVKGATAVITTIRAGFEEGRAKDERICMNHGMLGQETTGAAGFAFACRSIPALVDYARMTFDSNPDAWLLNFTNPAGLTTQALNKEGYDRCVGICDSADSAKAYCADHLGVDKSAIETRVTGLNHLSFTTSIKVNGEEKITEFLHDDKFLTNAQYVFPKEIVQNVGSYLNEYLYYFLLEKEALKAVLSEEKSRGELIVGWNSKLLNDLEALDLKTNADKGLDYYMNYTRHRNESYMDYATGGERYLPTDEEEGYAGVALDFLEAYSGTEPKQHTLIVPNNGNLKELEDHEVIEVTCEISNGSIKPLPAGDLNKDALNLVKSVKRYESIGVDAIAEQSIEGAIEALRVHPLIKDNAIAEAMMKDFMAAQEQSFSKWR